MEGGRMSKTSVNIYQTLNFYTEEEGSKFLRNAVNDIPVFTFLTWGSTFLQNVSNDVSDYTAPYSRRQYASYKRVCQDSYSSQIWGSHGGGHNAV
jgi:hypothetical protein